MKQMSVGAVGFERKTKRTRKREFLDEMDLVVPWAELVALILNMKASQEKWPDWRYELTKNISID